MVSIRDFDSLCSGSNPDKSTKCYSSKVRATAMYAGDGGSIPSGV